MNSSSKPDDVANPFAAPLGDRSTAPLASQDGIAIQAERVFCDGRFMVCGPSSVLPHYCLKTGEPAEQFVNHTFRWHHPAFYLLLFLGVFPYFVFALLAQQSIPMRLPVSNKVFRRRNRWVATLIWFQVLAAIALLGGGYFLAVSPDYQNGFWVWLVIWLIVIFETHLIRRSIAGVVAVKRISKNQLWLRGVHKDVLARLSSDTQESPVLAEIA